MQFSLLKGIRRPKRLQSPKSTETRSPVDGWPVRRGLWPLLATMNSNTFESVKEVSWLVEGVLPVERLDGLRGV